MSSFAISSSSSFSLSNASYQPSRLCVTIRNPRSNLEFRRLRFGAESRRTGGKVLSCNCCSKGTGGKDLGENANKSVLDAFFLGKALAEVINERIESTVGEVLGTIGRFQAEQQKQVQEIQEEVLERARRAKERASQETMEAQGLVASKPATLNQKPPAVTPASTIGSNTISSSSSDEDCLNDGS